MPQLSREDYEARYKLFDRFALDDQRHYYQAIMSKNRSALSQVNRLIALFSFLAGIAAALTGLLVARDFVAGAQCNQLGYPGSCATQLLIINILMIITIIAPVLGALFNTFADLYQWERVNIHYDAALENLEVADAQSPLPEMDDLTYRASIRALVEGTLSVMQDETTQWGQSIRTPEALQKFVEAELEKTARVNYGSATNYPDQGEQG